MWATVLNGYYPKDANLTLTSGSVYVPANGYLEFYHFYTTDDYNDRGNVKISTNNGATWTIIYPQGNYPITSGTLGEPCYAGYQSSWQLAHFDLSPYAGMNVKLKWTFASDSYYNYYGWYIDDVHIANLESAKKK
jgi:bacillopeptidase F (M6 metalloprotease family)